MSQSMDGSDERLGERISAGSESAFRELYYSYRDVLYKYALQLTRDAEVSKDIVSEVFLTIWKLKDNLKNINDIRAYAYVSCRNKSYDFLKYGSGLTSRREVSTADLQEVSTDQTLSDQILRDIILKEHVSAVRKAVDTLPDQRKKVLQLFLFDGLAIQEIAEQLQITASHVRSTKAQALSQLKGMLESLIMLFAAFFL